MYHKIAKWIQDKLIFGDTSKLEMKFSKTWNVKKKKLKQSIFLFKTLIIF